MNLKCVVFDEFFESIDDEEVAIFVVVSIITLNNAHALQRLNSVLCYTIHTQCSQSINEMVSKERAQCKKLHYTVLVSEYQLSAESPTTHSSPLDSDGDPWNE